MLSLKSYRADYFDTPGEYYTDEPQTFDIVECYPSSVSTVPSHLPNEVERLFRQGTDNTPGNPDAAGIMFRKALEATLRDKCPEATGSLFRRIDKAADVGVLTTDLAQYAHTIRLEGNEAAHGTYEEADAEKLRSLATHVLTYVYSLPGMQAEIDEQARAAIPEESTVTS